MTSSRQLCWDGRPRLAESTETFAQVTAPNTDCGPVDHCRDPEGVAFDPETGLLYVLFEDSGVVGAFGITVIPEPSTWALLGLGIAGLAVTRRVRP